MTTGGAPATGLEFDQVARRYDRARPGYPRDLFTELAALTGIGRGSVLLEVGSGTGKATIPLARLGCRITCLEPGRNLAALAAAKLRPGDRVEIMPVTLERFDPAGRRFDLVYAATSWHWTDPDARYRKAAALLRPGGALAVWAAMHAFPDGYDTFFDDIQPAYDAIGSGQQPGSQVLPPDHVPDHLAPEIAASGAFGPATTRRFTWAQTCTAAGYIELITRSPTRW